MLREISITKIFTFDSAHKINSCNGKCENLHGHTYKLEVTVFGKPDEFGLVMDFGELKKIVKDKVISYIDHKYLNEVFKFNPTCELIADWIWDKCKECLQNHNCKLHRITLWETPTSFVTIEA